MREARNQGRDGRHARPALVAPGLLRPEVAARAGGLPVVELVRADACAARPVEPVALGSELHVPEMGQPSPVLACALKGARNRPAPPLAIGEFERTGDGRNSWVGSAGGHSREQYRVTLDPDDENKASFECTRNGRPVASAEVDATQGPELWKTGSDGAKEFYNEMKAEGAAFAAAPGIGVGMMNWTPN